MVVIKRKERLAGDGGMGWRTGYPNDEERLKMLYMGGKDATALGGYHPVDAVASASQFVLTDKNVAAAELNVIPDTYALYGWVTVTNTGSTFYGGSLFTTSIYGDTFTTPSTRSVCQTASSGNIGTGYIANPALNGGAIDAWQNGGALQTNVPTTFLFYGVVVVLW